MTPVDTYIAAVRQLLKGGIATEHSYRPAFKNLIEGLGQGVTATNDPKRIECGAPDFIVTKGPLPLGYIETKDVGRHLGKEEKSEQMQRYLSSLSNLILTDYVHFRWYVQGQLRLSGSLGAVEKKGAMHLSKGGADEVTALLTAFLETLTPTVSSPKDLAARMASIARLIRTTIEKTFAYESTTGSLHQQMESFREVLLHNLTDAQFADMYAQTICYGLFAARANANSKKPFARESAAYDLPKTNPFLRKMFGHIAGPELDDRIVWVVDDLAALLNRADMKVVLAHFGKHAKKEDPVLHFYETFLQEYDPALRERLGVYFTPEPVVEYMVQSVDDILRTTFALPQGLADSSEVDVLVSSGKKKKQKRTFHRVVVLDPATGTGTFLHSVISHIHGTITKKNKGMWSGYVSRHLLPRLFGFEILMAPYAVAHMKLGLQLARTGYDFSADERLRVYLTNTLEEAHELTKLPLFAQWIADEANAANVVKQDAPVMVVLGNPPYSGHSSNKGKWITGLIEDYKQINGKKVKLGQGKWLQNDYVKFIRFAQYRIAQTGYGIMAMITDHSYVDSGTFVAMRANLLSFFDDIYVLDLNGDAKRNANKDDVDKPVFDITQGVAIIVAVKKGKGAKKTATVRAASWRGTRESKFAGLASSSVQSTEWETVDCAAPYYLFTATTGSQSLEYGRLPSIADVFPGTYEGEASKRIGTGFVTTHDSFAIAFTPDEIGKNVEEFLETTDEDDARRHFTLCGQSQWNYAKAKVALKNGKWRDEIRPVLYRPFDNRYTVWNPHVCVHRRVAVTQHLRNDNIALLVGQAGNVIGSEKWSLGLVTRHPPDFNVFYRGGEAVLPLFLYPEAEGDLFEDPAAAGQKRANVDPILLAALEKAYGVPFQALKKGGKQKAFSARDIVNYVYAILYSPTFRERYGEMLMVDYPRIPFTKNLKLFVALARVGGQLIDLHLGDAAPKGHVSYPIAGSNDVERVAYVPPDDHHAGRVYINGKQYFEGVDAKTFEFAIGGYAMCHKWLKDRTGLVLSFEDLERYQILVASLVETQAMMAEVDAVISKHGGWPLKVIALKT
jgi:predicted helicase